MAIGDPVIVTSATSVVLVFQPAATVVLMVTSLAQGNVNQGAYYTDGIVTNEIITSRPLYLGPNVGNMKMFIDNTLYLQMNTSAGARTGFSGIQVQ